MTLEERMTRLERCFLFFAAAITGEAVRLGTPEEIEACAAQLGADMQAMAEEMES